MADEQPKAVQAGDELTVLACRSGHTASKRIVAGSDGKPELHGFNAGMFFRISRLPVANVHELSATLLALEALPHVLVIRGEPKSGVETSRDVRRNKETFATPARGRRWILVDFDKIPIPSGLSVTTDAKAVAEHLIAQLPAEFHDVTYHYQLSSSAGLGATDIASMHVWFWLSEPRSDEELKRWAKRLNKALGRRVVDPALFNDVQAHYVAAPIFVEMADPLPVRSALVEKTKDEVDLHIPEDESDQERTARASGRHGASPGFEAILPQIGDHPGGQGFHEPIIRAAASYVATHGREGTDVQWLFETIRKRVLEADRSHHDPAYVEHMASETHIMQAIDGALAKFGNADPRRKARLVEGQAPHYANEAQSEGQANAMLDAALRSFLRFFPWQSK